MNGNELWIFHPPRQRGTWIHGLLWLISLVLGGLALSQWVEQRPGLPWLLWLILAAMGGLGILWFGYRLMALWRATYQIERDGLRLRWGLRIEHLPLAEVEWIRPGSELGFALPLPAFAWPGAILGSRNVPELGEVEFMASEADALLLIATPRRVLAISPADPRAFMRAFRQALEMGSLSPITPYSARPAAFLSHLWQDMRARLLIATGSFLLMGLLSLTSLMAASYPAITLGYTPQGQPLPPVPSQRLMLLPILGAFTYGSGFALGLYFYRQEERPAKAYLLWGGGILTLILLLVACLLAGRP